MSPVADSLIRMSRLYVPMLLLLAAIWGASSMCTKAANRKPEPTTLMAARILLAAVILFGILAARCGTARAATRVRRAGWAPLLLGIVNAALPFTLIAWGEKHVDSGVAAIANASMPIFVALLALRFRHSERSSGLRLVGVVIGLAGVAVLAGVNPRGGWWAAPPGGEAIRGRPPGAAGARPGARPRFTPARGGGGWPGGGPFSPGFF